MRELLQQALAALKTCDWDYDQEEHPYLTYDQDAVADAIESLEHELNKPEFLTGWRDHASPYEQGFVDGMAKQAQSSVDRTVNTMGKKWIGLTNEEIDQFEKWYDEVEERKGWVDPILTAQYFEVKLKDKNHGSV